MEITKETMETLEELGFLTPPPRETYSSLERLFQNAREYWAIDCDRIARDKYGDWIYCGTLEKKKGIDERKRWYRVDLDSQKLKAIRRYDAYMITTTVIYYREERTIRYWGANPKFVKTGEIRYWSSFPHLKTRGKNKGQPDYGSYPYRSAMKQIKPDVYKHRKINSTLCRELELAVDEFWCNWNYDAHHSYGGDEWCDEGNENNNVYISQIDIKILR